VLVAQGQKSLPIGVEALRQRPSNRPGSSGERESENDDSSFPLYGGMGQGPQRGVQPPPISFNRSSKLQRRLANGDCVRVEPRRLFTDEEVQALREGIARYRAGEWENIKSASKGRRLDSRSPEEIKVKFRNMARTGKI
jgi:Myb-like DNA-binding domain